MRRTTGARGCNLQQVLNNIQVFLTKTIFLVYLGLSSSLSDYLRLYQSIYVYLSLFQSLLVRLSLLSKPQPNLNLTSTQRLGFT